MTKKQKTLRATSFPKAKGRRERETPRDLEEASELVLARGGGMTRHGKKLIFLDRVSILVTSPWRIIYLLGKGR